MTEIDGYTDLVEIGRGGFAVVYKAQQVSVGRDVAIKLLTDPSPDDDLVRRFQRESKAVGALSWHPHIAAVVDAGSTALGQAFIVFELLPGGSLEDRLDLAALPWQEAVASMIQVADAVEAAHRADVLHRDIKPANILLDRLGVAKLGDFGIASMQDGTKTETGMLATTVAHAAPELFDGDPSSAATDVYALGSTLHTLVTGEPPFAPAPGERIATTIAQIISNPPPRPDESIVPLEIATVIAHALAKQPQYRPRSAAAFGQALQEAQRDLGERVTAMPVSDKGPAKVKPVDRSVKATNKMRPNEPAPAPPAAVAPAPRPAAAAPPRGSANAPVNAPPENDSETRHVPFTNPGDPVAPRRKPLGRTIAALSVIAVLLAAGLGALVLVDRDPIVVATTTPGGAEVQRGEAFGPTEMASPFDGQKAIDNDTTTQWGIAPVPGGPQIVGSSYKITLVGEQTITHVGIANPNRTDLGRISGIVWGTGFDENGMLTGPLVTQAIDNAAGDFLEPFDVTTKTITLAITGVHDDAPNAGVGEILIQVADESSADG